MNDSQFDFLDGSHPLDGGHPQLWSQLLDAVDPATLLAFVRWNMSARLRRYSSEEDVLQDGLLSAWRARASFEWHGLSSFRRWLLAVLRNRLRDLAEQQESAKRGGDKWIARFSEIEAARNLAGSGAPDELGLAWASTTPSRMAVHQEQADRMQVALEGLPDELREVVRLRLFEESTMEEIGLALSLGVEATRHRFRKGARLYAERLARELDRGSSAAEQPAHR